MLNEEPMPPSGGLGTPSLGGLGGGMGMGLGSPPMGGLGGPGGGLGSPMGLGGPPMGGGMDPSGQMPMPPKQPSLTPLNVWDLLEKLLNGETIDENKDKRQPPQQKLAGASPLNNVLP